MSGPTYGPAREAALRELLIALVVFAYDLLGRFKRWLTFRRVLGIVAFLVLLVCFRYFLLMGMDITFFFGLDLGLITEVSALLIILGPIDIQDSQDCVWLIQFAPGQVIRSDGNGQAV